MYHIGDWVVRSSGAGKEDNSGRRTVFQFGRISLVLRVRACVRKEQARAILIETGKGKLYRESQYCSAYRDR